MKKNFAWCRLILVIILALSCLSIAACSSSDDAPLGISYIGGMSSMGGSGDNNQYQTLKYSWEFKNNNEEEVVIQWIEPELSAELEKLLVTEDIKVDVGKAVDPGETVEVEGTVTFDASGLSKQKIVDENLITGVKISVESIVKMPG